MKKQSDILVIGRDYKAQVFAHFLPPEQTAVLISSEGASEEPPEKVSYLGNGEFPETAEKIFGKDLKDLFWSLSQKNQEEIFNFSKTQPLDATSTQVKWVKENRLESGVRFNPHALNRLPSLRTSQTLKIEGAGLDLRVITDSEEYEPKIIILVDDYLATKNFTYLADKCIPVTLPLYAQKLKGASNPELELFNAGADFTYTGESLRYFGSFRNLFQDKAVGLKVGSDPVSEKNIRSFFSASGQLDNDEELLCFSLLESISCDGLPIVGNLPQLPNVHVCIGFAGKPQNFIFEVAKRMAKGILSHGQTDGLEAFSTKRFI